MKIANKSVKACVCINGVNIIMEFKINEKFSTEDLKAIIRQRVMSALEITILEDI